MTAAICWALKQSAGGYLNDLYQFDPVDTTWRKLAVTGSVPTRRHMHGLTATPDGMLYVFGGFDMTSSISSQIYGSE